MIGIVKVNHRDKTVRMNYRKDGKHWEHHFVLWLQKEVEMALRDYSSKSKGRHLMGSFEMVFPLLDEVHEYRLRATIHQYLDQEIRLGRVRVHQKYSLTNKYLKVIRETPMVFYSAIRRPNSGY